LASDYHNPTSEPEQPRGQSDSLAPSEDIARYVTNFRLTPEGTLRSLQPPAEYVSRWRLDAAGYIENSPTLSRSTTAPFNGVFHATLDEFGARDVTLFHFRGTVYEQRGWNAPGDNQWWPVYGANVPASGSYSTAFPSDSSKSKFLTQFVRLPSGILIIPQDARAVVYDGYSPLYLGYSASPGAPEPLSPQALTEHDATGLFSSTKRTTYPNGGGWNLTGRELPYSFGSCRLGTIDVLAGSSLTSGGTISRKANPNGGTLKEGMIRARQQWVNVHGDLSPASPPSTAWVCQKEDNTSQDRKLFKTEEDEPAADMRLQAWWGGISPGPDGTVGRVFIKTRDLVNSGDPVFYEVPANSSAGLHEFATIPDNICDFYPDNVPESWLVTPYTAVDPMPIFRLACLFAGRLWIANTPEEPGMVRASLPGRWGTLPESKDIFYPDPTGRAVTAIFACASGMLVFTERSTFLMVPNDSGEGFQFATISNSVGCVSPNSIATLSSGETVWLSREGFHAWDGEKLRELSKGFMERQVRHINPARRHRACAVVDPDMGEYRCWVAVDRSDDNNYCFIYDGARWRERTDLVVDAACVTDDERQYVLAAGTVSVNAGAGREEGLYVLDHAGAWTKEFAYTSPAVSADAVPDLPTWRFRSAWLRSSRAHRRGSPVRIRLWFRETQQARISVKVFRDWRESPAVHEIPATDSKAADRFSTDDPPVFYDSTVLGATVTYGLTRTERGSVAKAPAAFQRRRPYWTKMDISVPSCEVFAFELEGDGDFEFVGYQYVENAASHHGGNSQTGGKR
jgi:hypothetical protein